MEPVPLKYGKLLATKYPWIYGIFYSVQSEQERTLSELFYFVAQLLYADTDTIV